MLQEGLPGAAEQTGKFGPGIRTAHVDDSDRLDPWFRCFNAKEARGLAALNTAPELPLSRDNEVLIERIGMSGDLRPFAAAGDYRKDRTPSRNHPHVVLQLRHVFLGCHFLRERPGQHELGLEDRTRRLNTAVERRRHPAQYWVTDLPLDVGEYVTGIALIPAPVQIFGRNAELNDEIT